MIGDLNRGMEGFIDWNIAVDPRGGPRHTPGGFSAPIVCPDDGGYVEQLAYAFIRLFSQTVPPGSVVIGSSSYCRDIEAAAVRRPDGSYGALVLNHSDRDLKIGMRYSGKVAEFTVPAFGMIGAVTEKR